tara:strand:- start:456 stop:1247 length:792 start_codon:yes stop_codon:yes gene_type:complete
MIGIGATLFKIAFVGGRGFSPASLFAGGERGAWYDPSDLSSMFQLSDGTVAAAVNQPVGYIADKSGNGNHAIQATATKRPILKESGGLYYLEFDGVDDGLVSSSIDFTNNDEMSVFAGVRLDTAGTKAIAELSDSASSNTNTFRLTAISSNIWRYASRGDSALRNANANGYSVPTTDVLTGLSTISGDSAILRVDGSEEGSVTQDQGAGNYGNYPVNIGSRNNGASQVLDGRIYGLIVRGVLSGASEITATELYMASKTGVSL